MFQRMGESAGEAQKRRSSRGRTGKKKKVGGTRNWGKLPEKWGPKLSAERKDTKGATFVGTLQMILRREKNGTTRGKVKKRGGLRRGG